MKHILVVDDAEAIAYLFQKYFRAHRYRVTVAYDGKKALEASKIDPIDGVVTDFRMPGMNGEALVKCLRERQPDLPAIIVTAFPDVAPEQNKNTKVFGKPIDPMILVNQMTDLLVDLDTLRGMKDQK